MRNNNLISFIIALLYASCLTFLIPVDDSIIDRANYLIYAQDSLIIFLRYLNNGLMSMFFNEPIWLFINICLSYFFEPENTLRIIIFFSSFTVSFLVFKHNPKYFLILLLFLIFPSIIKNFIIHLRQGLAISFFLIGWFSKSNKIKYSFFLLSPFIHASFFFVLVIYFMSYMLQKIKFAFDLKFISYVFLGLTFSFGLGFIASNLGARQANEYEFTTANISGLGFIFWTIIVTSYLISGKQFFKNNSFIIGMLLFYLTTYFFIEVTARIFESALILILLASLELKYKTQLFVCGLIVLLAMYQILLRINQPYLGFGI